MKYWPTAIQALAELHDTPWRLLPSPQLTTKTQPPRTLPSVESLTHQNHNQQLPLDASARLATKAGELQTEPDAGLGGVLSWRFRRPLSAV